MAASALMFWRRDPEAVAAEDAARAKRWAADKASREAERARQAAAPDPSIDLRATFQAVADDFAAQPENVGLIEPARLRRSVLRAAWHGGSTEHFLRGLIELREQLMGERDPVIETVLAAEQENIAIRVTAQTWTAADAVKRAIARTDINPRLRGFEADALIAVLPDGEEIIGYDSAPVHRFHFSDGTTYDRRKLREVGRPLTITSAKGLQAWADEFPKLDTSTGPREVSEHIFRDPSAGVVIDD